jgi:hypothetical protein
MANGADEPLSGVAGTLKKLFSKTRFAHIDLQLLYEHYYQQHARRILAHNTSYANSTPMTADRTGYLHHPPIVTNSPAPASPSGIGGEPDSNWVRRWALGESRHVRPMPYSTLQPQVALGLERAVETFARCRAQLTLACASRAPASQGARSSSHLPVADATPKLPIPLARATYNTDAVWRRISSDTRQQLTMALQTVRHHEESRSALLKWQANTTTPSRTAVSAKQRLPQLIAPPQLNVYPGAPSPNRGVEAVSPLVPVHPNALAVAGTAGGVSPQQARRLRSRLIAVSRPAPPPQQPRHVDVEHK